MPPALEHNIDTTNILTMFNALWNALTVARSRDVLEEMTVALVTDAKRLHELADQRKAPAGCSLAEAYNRYLANMREMKATEISAHAIQAFIGPKLFDELVDKESGGFVWLDIEMHPSAQELRDSAKLWQHLHTYLRFAHEARVSEALELFGQVGIAVSRPALESALKAHPKLFRIRKSGREVFLSLRKEVK
jgi:hypothetical protein